MNKHLLEEINRIKFITNYDNSTTINEQTSELLDEQRLKKAWNKYRRFTDKYSPIRFERGSEWDVDAGRTRNIIDKSWGKSGGEDERYYEDGKVYTGADDEGMDFEEDEEWRIGDSEMNPKIAAELSKGERFQYCSKGMQKAMDPNSKERWLSLIQEFQTEPDKKSLLGDAIFDAVNVYADKYTDKDCGTPRKKLKIAVGDDSFVDEIEKTIEIPADKPQDIEVTVSFPVKNNPNANFFKNNSSEIEDLFITEVDSLIATIKSQMSQMKNPKVYLSYLHVKTSCSRLRNQGLAVDKTWTKLSQERTNAAKNYLLQKLDEAGVMRDEQDGVLLKTEYVFNSKGTNGDGSSGPNGKEPFRFNTDGLGNWYCGDATTKGKACAGERNAFGTPVGEEDLEKNKYLIAELGLAFKGQEPDPDTKEPKYSSYTENVNVEMYNVRFILPGKSHRFRLWLPQIVIRVPKKLFNGFFQRLFSGKTKKPVRRTNCFFND